MWLSYGAERDPGQLVNRGVTGDTDWTTHHVVLDIPDEAKVISYGVFLEGPGKVWIDDARIEVVTEEMPTTAIRRQYLDRIPHHPIDLTTLPRIPRNLDFDLDARTDASACE